MLEMSYLSTRTLAVAASILLAFGALASCSNEPELQLTAAAQEGRSVALDNGCASCHGKNGQGVTAPSWQGIYLEQIPLDGGISVLGDEDYLYRSISDPQAQIVEGWTIKMPENDLTDSEIASVIAFIKELQ